MDQTEASERLQDIGLAKPEADLRAKTLEVDRRRHRVGLYDGLTVSRIQKLYSDGLLTRDDAAEKIQQPGFTAFEAVNSLDAADYKFDLKIRTKQIEAVCKCPALSREKLITP